jgi:hypothetical protein
MKSYITILILAVLSLSAFAADITGTWKAEFDTQIGLQKYSFDFRVTDGKVSGKGTAETGDQKRDVELKDVKLSGDTLTFVEMRQIQDREIPIEFSGKVNDKGIQFTRKVGEFGTQQALATRIAGTAPSNSNAQGNRPQSGRGRGGFGGPIELGPDDKAAFPNPADGFDKAREDIEHGKVKWRRSSTTPNRSGTNAR